MPVIRADAIDNPDIGVGAIPGPLVQKIEIRMGDDLPGFAAIVEDEIGNPVDLTGATVELIIAPTDGAPPFIYQMFMPNPAAGVVQFDWSGEHTELWGQGVFDVSVEVRRPGGGNMAAPSDHAVLLTIRPPCPSDD